jgi:hypothetical protein
MGLALLALLSEGWWSCDVEELPSVLSRPSAALGLDDDEDARLSIWGVCGNTALCDRRCGSGSCDDTLSDDTAGSLVSDMLLWLVRRGAAPVRSLPAEARERAADECWLLRRSSGSFWRALLSLVLRSISQRQRTAARGAAFSSFVALSTRKGCGAS